MSSNIKYTVILFIAFIFLARSQAGDDDEKCKFLNVGTSPSSPSDIIKDGVTQEPWTGHNTAYKYRNVSGMNTSLAFFYVSNISTNYASPDMRFQTIYQETPKNSKKYNYSNGTVITYQYTRFKPTGLAAADIKVTVDVSIPDCGKKSTFYFRRCFDTELASATDLYMELKLNGTSRDVVKKGESELHETARNLPVLTGEMNNITLVGYSTNETVELASIEVVADERMMTYTVDRLRGDRITKDNIPFTIHFNCLVNTTSPREMEVVIKPVNKRAIVLAMTKNCTVSGEAPKPTPQPPAPVPASEESSLTLWIIGGIFAAVLLIIGLGLFLSKSKLLFPTPNTDYQMATSLPKNKCEEVEGEEMVTKDQ